MIYHDKIELAYVIDIAAEIIMGVAMQVLIWWSYFRMKKAMKARGK